MIKKTLNEKDIIELFTFKKKIDNNVNKTSSKRDIKQSELDVKGFFRYNELNVILF